MPMIFFPTLQKFFAGYFFLYKNQWQIKAYEKFKEVYE